MPAFGAGFGEAGVLRQKAVARMDALRRRALRATSMSFSTDEIAFCAAGAGPIGCASSQSRTCSALASASE